jgi:DNA (cytosine-5)-methyltransferase 1
MGQQVRQRRPDDAVGADGSDRYTSIEICAGAGGQAYGLELAGFRHLALVENDEWCCRTLRSRPRWRKAVREIDLHEWSAVRFRKKVDLFAGGVPCPPFSRAGQKLGPEDERDLFPQAIKLIKQCTPRAILLENVRGLLSREFEAYRKERIERPLRRDYAMHWKLVQAADFGVPQLRPRAVLVALRREIAPFFSWPDPNPDSAPTVGEALERLMASKGWPGAAEWARVADGIAPTLVGGSKKHGGPDLGPTQAKKQWRQLGVNGLGLADEPPPADWDGEPPMLTVKMAAVLQGFPADWPFEGRKTNAYRQVGNAFPPPVAEAVGNKIWQALAAFDAQRIDRDPELGTTTADDRRPSYV